jgi:hypothetical protein
MDGWRGSRTQGARPPENVGCKDCPRPQTIASRNSPKTICVGRVDQVSTGKDQMKDFEKCTLGRDGVNPPM